ncbi:uncharacterized protein LOC135394165 [Ornithodoros turicata]|uniref:uncharacterized protein LOC135394165 n=1 Tax=Ornithodoros turicata TaxID=34597 RepID=UPI003139ED12
MAKSGRSYCRSLCLFTQVQATNGNSKRHRQLVLLTLSNRHSSRTSACNQIQTSTAIYPHQAEAISLKKATEEVAVLPKSIYKERLVTVTSCSELFKSWKTTRPGYKYVNPNGVRVTVPYIHTGLDRNAGEGPTVVAIHGAPGNYNDFSALTSELDSLGASVVVPTLPDLDFSMETQSFWHSVEEKADLLKQYLTAINLKEIDMFVTHSSSMYPILRLAVHDPDIRVRSLVFIAPAGCRRIAQLSPFWIMKNFDAWFRVPWLQRFMCDLAVYIVRVLGKPNNNQIKGTILSMITMMHAKYDEAGPMVRDLKRRNIPMLMLFGEKDKLIDCAVSNEMAAMLGVTAKQMWMYKGKDDREAELVQKGLPHGNSEVVCFKQGTHFAFKKFPTIFNHIISRFFEEHITKKQY